MGTSILMQSKLKNCRKRKPIILPDVIRMGKHIVKVILQEECGVVIVILKIHHVMG